MLTTSKPVAETFKLDRGAGAKSWLTYKEDLNTACSKYGATVQGKEAIARSITIDDVNRVMGLEPPTSFNTYTFGKTLDYANKLVDFTYPDPTTSNYINTGTTTTTFTSDAYFYNINTTDNSVQLGYEANSWTATDYENPELKNVDLILGENYNYVYVLNSKSVRVMETGAAFCVGSIEAAQVSCNNLMFLGGSNTQSLGPSSDVPMRPVINLPSDVIVKKVNGEWIINEE